MSTTRRDFLHTVAGATAGLGLAGRLVRADEPKPVVQAAPRVRKDIATLKANSPDLVALKKAVAIMKDPNANIPACETWANWTAIHGTVNGGFNKCQHGNWYIWPWHRMYVYFFEQIVSKLSGDAGFALPYWNWSKAPTIPAPFWQAPLLDMNRTVTQGQPIPTPSFNQFVSPTVINNILNIASFPAFGGTANGSGQLESQPHNFIHNWIGGDMGTGGSPTDAIFWMHHCNCDRLYSAWIHKHPKGLPTAPAWLNHEFKDFCGKGLKVSQTSNSTTLGYTYDKFTVTAKVGPVPQLPEAVVVEGPGTKERKTVGAAVVFALSPKEGAAATIGRVTAGATDPRASTIQLELLGVKVPMTQNVRVSVFINAEKPSADLLVSDPHYVTSFTFFHGPHGEKKPEHKDEKKPEHKEDKKPEHKEDKKPEHKDDGTVTLFVDATHTLHRLYGDQAFGAEETLNVQIVVAPLFPDRDDAYKGTVQELAPSEIKLIAAAPKE